MKITISCRQEQHYVQEVEVTEDEFKLLQSVDQCDIGERSTPKQYNLIESLIDFNDILDSTREFKAFGIIED